jgi:hypothetical protein
MYGLVADPYRGIGSHQLKYYHGHESPSRGLHGLDGENTLVIELKLRISLAVHWIEVFPGEKQLASTSRPGMCCNSIELKRCTFKNSA